MHPNIFDKAVMDAGTSKALKLYVYNARTNEEAEIQKGSLMEIILSETLNYVSTITDVINRFVPKPSSLKTEAYYINKNLAEFASLFYHVLISTSFNKVFCTIPGEPIVDLLKYQSLMFALRKVITDMPQEIRLCHVEQIELPFRREPDYNCFLCDGTEGIIQAFSISTISDDTYRIIRK